MPCRLRMGASLSPQSPSRAHTQIRPGVLLRLACGVGQEA